ncbi:hypothetical protein [Brumimicrobium oceani]|nr:hypothetical protein [Brumimicrobium oceani]
MKSILFIIFTLVVTLAQAQPRVVTFDSEQEESLPKEESNVIKFNLLELMSSGDYSLYYEKALLNVLSAEIGLGITSGDNWGDFGSDTYFYNSKEENKIGFSFAAALRFYPSELFEDFYVSAEYKFRKYRWDREVMEFTSNYSAVISSIDESRRHSIARLNFGYILFLTNQLSLDSHFGLGINMVQEIYYNNQSFILDEKKSGVKPRVNLGLKIGYLF